MSIHYIGNINPTPGQRVCGDTEGQAESYDLFAVDCLPCKTGLVGIVIQHAEPGSVPMTIVTAEQHQVALELMPGSPPLRMPWQRLDIPNPWVVVSPPPATGEGQS